MATETRSGQGPFTYADLLRAPEDHVKREIIDGWLYIEGQPADALDEVVEVTSPVRAHQDAVGALFLAVQVPVRESGGWAAVAPMDVRFADGRTLQPDVLYVAPEDADRVLDRVEDVVPAWVAEVSSPATRSHDLLRKRRVYEEAGVPEYWFVDLEAERVEVYRLRGRRYGTPALLSRGEVVESEAVPHLRVAVDDLLPAYSANQMK